MLLNQQDIDEFREPYIKDSGEFITDAEAREMATRLLGLYERLAEPLPSERTRDKTSLY